MVECCAGVGAFELFHTREYIAGLRPSDPNRYSSAQTGARHKVWWVDPVAFRVLW